MHKIFSLNELNKKSEEIQSQRTDQSSIHAARFLEKHNIKLDNLKSLTGRFPDPGEAFFLWTLNSFNAFTFIVYVIKTHGSITDLTLSTYSINDRILTSLIKWYDKGHIGKVNISISDGIRQRNPRIYDQLESQKRNRDIDIRYTWNHSKVTLMKTPEHHFVVEGSGNFSENAAHEQYLFTNDSALYDFRYNCIMN